LGTNLRSQVGARRSVINPAIPMNQDRLSILRRPKASKTSAPDTRTAALIAIQSRIHRAAHKSRPRAHRHLLAKAPITATPPIPSLDAGWRVKDAGIPRAVLPAFSHIRYHFSVSGMVLVNARDIEGVLLGR
jgi:hypothetical protein